MAREIFKNLPDKTTPLSASKLNGIFNGEEAMGSIVVEDIKSNNLFNALDGNYDWKTETYHIGSYTKDNENKLTIVNGGDWAKLGCTISGLEPNTQYTISTNVTNPSGETCGLWSQSYGNVLKTDTTFKATLTLTTNTSGILTFAFYTNFLGTYKGTTVTFDNIQLEKGSTATEYTPYKKFGYNSQESMGKIVIDDISGRNLLPISEMETITLSKQFYFDEPLKAGTYRISVDSVISNGTAGIYLFHFIRSDGVDGYYFYLEDGNLAEAITIGAECKGVTIYSQKDWVTSNGKTTTFNKAMITKDSAATKYIPYKKYGYNKDKNMGKILVSDISCNNSFNKYGSLSDYDGWTSGTTTLQSNGTIKATANMANGNGKGQFINVKPNTKYTISFKVIEMETTGSYNVRIKSVGLETNTTLYTYENTSTGYKTFTFTTNECNTIWVSICGINNASSVNTFKYVIYDEFQLEKGSIATEYAPYKEFNGRTDIITGQETPTNEYIDGKRVYVKRIDFGALPNSATTKTIAHGLTNFTPVRFNAVANTGTYFIQLPHASATLAGNIAFGISATAIEITPGQDRSGFTAVVDIYYTKTDTSTASEVSTTSLEEGEIDG